MVPATSDPRWRHVLGNIGKVPISDLSAKMMLSRVKLKISFDTSEPTMKQAISDVHAFFIKNEASLKNDIKAIFG